MSSLFEYAHMLKGKVCIAGNKLSRITCHSHTTLLMVLHTPLKRSKLVQSLKCVLFALNFDESTNAANYKIANITVKYYNEY